MYKLKLRLLPKLNRRQQIGVLIIFLVVGAIFFVEYRSVTSESISSWTQDLAADCAVVLTGGSYRVREGFDLLSRGQVKKLIVSGVHPDAQLREIMPYWSLYGELNERDVILDRRSGTTYGNAQQTLPIVEVLGCRDIALVTSSVHMRRAFSTFQAAYPETVSILKHAVPPGKKEGRFFEISTEVLKSIFYRFWAY